MPRLLAEQLDYSTLEYLRNGLRVSLFNVPRDSVVQVQFPIAWSDTTPTRVPRPGSRWTKPPRMLCLNCRKDTASMGC